MVATATPTEVPLAGDIAGVGDPTVAVEGGVTYLYSTGPGIPIRRSTDLVTWELVGRALVEDVPPWALAAVPTANDVWAPDLSYWGGEWHLYYAVSRVTIDADPVAGSTSVIGHATSPTLDPDDPSYGWIDHGMVLRSEPLDLINAIDAEVVLDDAGAPHLAWGSYREGLVLQTIDPATGLLEASAPRIALARRPAWWAGLEATSLVHRDGWWYLFASFDWCCLGERSNYNVRVGRSRDLEGPYVDVDGHPMLEDGGTILLRSEGARVGPGHQDVHQDAAGDWWLLHHWEATEAGPGRVLGLHPLEWSADGWPHVRGEPAPTPTTAATTTSTTTTAVPTTVPPTVDVPARAAKPVAATPSFAG